MAEDGHPVEGDPGTTGHSPDTGPGSATIPPTGGAPPTDPRMGELEQRLQQLEEQNKRYKSNIDGWRQESDRLRQRAETAEGSLRQHTERVAQVLGVSPTGATESPRAHAMFDNYLGGNAQALEPFNALLPLADPQTRRQEVLSVLTEVLQPAQFVNAVRQNHGDLLADANSDDYRDLVEMYDQLASDPLVNIKYEAKPSAVQEWMLPGGVGKRAFDLRIMDEAGFRLKMKRAHEQGRRDGVTQGARPGVEGAGPSPASSRPTSEPDAWDLMTKAEKAQMIEMVSRNEQPPGIPRDARKWAKQRVEKWPALVKEERVEKYRAGQLG